MKLAIPGLGYAVAWMQYIWRLGATVVAAIIFFTCAAMVFLRKDPQAAPVRTAKKTKRATLTLAPVRVTTVDAKRIWAEHERWLELATLAKVRAA